MSAPQEVRCHYAVFFIDLFRSLSNICLNSWLCLNCIMSFWYIWWLMKNYFFGLPTYFNLRFNFFSLFFFFFSLLNLIQVIKAFGLPEFFNSVFPLLFDMCNFTTLSKPGQAPLATDAAKTGYIQILEFSVLFLRFIVHINWAGYDESFINLESGRLLVLIQNMTFTPSKF